MDEEERESSPQSSAKQDSLRSRLTDLEIQERVLALLTPYQRKLLGDGAEGGPVASDYGYTVRSEKTELKGTRIFSFLQK